METIDTCLFLEIIVSEGALRIGAIVYMDDDIYEFYTARSGKKIQICTTDEFLTATTAKSYLSDLGFVDLIPTLFPVKKEVHQE